MNGPEGSPSPNRQTGNEKPGNHEKCNDGVQARPEQNPVQRLRKYVVDWVLAERKSQVNMVQNHGQDAESTQYIDARETILNRYFGFQVGQSLSRSHARGIHCRPHRGTREKHW